MVRTAEGQESAVGRYTSFGILLPDPQDLADEGMKIETLQQIASMSIDELKQKGYQPKPPQEADLIIVFGPRVNIYGTTRTKSDTGYEDDKYTRSMHAQGTLTIAFVDAKTKAIILKRVAETRLLQGGPSEEKMRKGIAQVFEPIPNAPLAAAAPAAPAPPAASVAPAAPPATAEATPPAKPAP